jgi:hypothetical protein
MIKPKLFYDVIRPINYDVQPQPGSTSNKYNNGKIDTVLDDLLLPKDVSDKPTGGVADSALYGEKNKQYNNGYNYYVENFSKKPLFLWYDGSILSWIADISTQTKSYDLKLYTDTRYKLVGGSDEFMQGIAFGFKSVGGVLGTPSGTGEPNTYSLILILENIKKYWYIFVPVMMILLYFIKKRRK